MTVHLIVNANLKKCLLNPLNKDSDTINWINWERSVTRLADKVKAGSTITRIFVAKKVGNK